jgi:hypothetical protein
VEVTLIAAPPGLTLLAAGCLFVSNLRGRVGQMGLDFTLADVASWRPALPAAGRMAYRAERRLQARSA